MAQNCACMGFSYAMDMVGAFNFFHLADKGLVHWIAPTAHASFIRHYIAF